MVLKIATITFSELIFFQYPKFMAELLLS